MRAWLGAQPRIWAWVYLTCLFGWAILYATFEDRWFVLFGLTNIVCIEAFRERHDFHGFKHMVVPIFVALANFTCIAFYIIGPLEGLGSWKEPIIAVVLSAIWGLYGAIYFVRASRRKGRDTVLMAKPA